MLVHVGTFAGVPSGQHPGHPQFKHDEAAVAPMVVLYLPTPQLTHVLAEEAPTASLHLPLGHACCVALVEPASQ